MKKTKIVVLAFIGFSFWFSGTTWGSNTTALRAVNLMLGSLNHIRTLSCDVEVRQQSPKKKGTTVYQLIVDQTGQKAAIFKRPVKQAYIHNKKGLYIVQNGEANRQPKGSEFPFEVPSHFLRGLKLRDVTDNYTFSVHSQTPDMIVVDMISVGTVGQTIETAFNSDTVSMIRFSIALPKYTLNRIEIYKNNQLVANDTIDIAYDMIADKATKKSDLMIVRTLSIRKLAGKGSDDRTDIKTTWYRNISINGPIPNEVFDEENY